ncbi:16729_t:CDS:2, partial [Gigaspora rosea]
PNGGTGSANGTAPTSIPLSTTGNGTGVVIPLSKTSGSYGLYGESIIIYALTKPLILVTYYCDYPTKSYQRCGVIVDWSSNSVKGSVITFENSCSTSQIIKNYKSDGFLYACYDYGNNVLIWTPYIVSTDGSVTNNTSGHTSEITQISNMTQFSKYVNIFPTENGDYGLVYTHFTSQSGQGITSPWSISAIWISSKDSSTTGAFPIYNSQPGTNTTDYYIYQCSFAHDTIGYNCLVYTKRTDKTVYVNINFWKSGSVIKTDEFSVNSPVINVIPLNYGGYLFVTQNNTGAGNVGNTNNGAGSAKGFIYYSNGTLYGPLDMDIPVFTTNNTLTIESTNSLTNFRPGGIIINRTPNSGAIVSPPIPQISLTYSVPVNKSTGYFKLWQVNSTGGDDILRAQIPASDNRVKINNNSVTVDLLPAFTASGSKEYYVTVDDDAIKYPDADQNLNGISKLEWNFTTSAGDAVYSTSDSSVILRLTPAGTSHYVNLSPNEQSTFINGMCSDIAKAVDCDDKRITMMKHYQYSNYNNSGDQIFMRAKIAPGRTGSTERSAPNIASDLNDMVKEKSISPALSTGTTAQYLDSNNGAWGLPELWNRYKFILIGVFAGLALLILLWYLACRNRF